MRILLLTSLLVMLLFTFALAHEGALSLYTDASLSSCDGSMPSAYSTVIVGLYYVRGDGPSLGLAVDFILYTNRSSEIIKSAEVWSGAITLTYCSDPFTQCLASGAGCLGGQGEDVVWIVTWTFMWLDFSIPPQGTVTDPYPIYLEVQALPTGDPPGIYITLCDDDNTRYVVLGGRFLINSYYPCNVGVKASSWGAIKQLYE